MIMRITPKKLKPRCKPQKALIKKEWLPYFQPHRYSRVKSLEEEFANSFSCADFVYVDDVYAAGERVEEPKLISQKLAQLISQKSKTQAIYCAGKSALVKKLLKKFKFRRFGYYFRCGKYLGSWRKFNGKLKSQTESRVKRTNVCIICVLFRKF